MKNKPKKIPKNLPQFEKLAALFISAGEYEAKFYVALDGKINNETEIKLPPREEAKDKQGFIGKRATRPNLASVSNRGRYNEDLKRKYADKIHKVIHDMIAKYKLKEIYITAPKYVSNRIIRNLDKEEKKKVRMKFYHQYTKLNPLKMLIFFNEQEQNAIRKRIPPTAEEIKILKKPLKKRILRKT